VSVLVDTRRRRLLFVGLLLLHLGAISHQVDGGNGLSLLQRGVFTLLSPLQRAMSAVVGLVEGVWEGYGIHRRTFEENRLLQEQVRRLEVLLQERSEQARESERLREMLGLREVLPLDTVVAEVVSRDGVPWFRSLTIARGTADGVSLDAPVMSPTGVVGRVIAVGPHAARVQVLLDRDAGVGVVIERTRVAGVVSGQVLQAESGTSDLVLKYVPERADVVVGDVVVTSGFDRIYPRGLTVGRVSAVGPGSGLLKEIRVQPSARFDRLEEVLVVRPAPGAPSLETPQTVQ
jgi:rod shape-determining protein MreC